ncbi:MAG TPA: hypothetical protein VGA99_14705 [bacterium]
MKNPNTASKGFFARLLSPLFGESRIVRMINILAVIAVVTAMLFGVGQAKFSHDKPAGVAVKSTPERLARGEYLVKHVAICLDCHSTREWNIYSAPAAVGTEGMGGERFGPEYGMPGTLYPRNITPAGIGHWTDADLVRALTQGVNKDGETLFPLMPYMMFRSLSQEDLFSIITYIRTLKPVENQVPKRQLAIPIEVAMPSTRRRSSGRMLRIAKTPSSMESIW